MAGRSLAETPFRDLLPDSIRDDPQFVAASQALDGMFAEVDEQVNAVLIWSRIDELEEPMLTNLAFQLHLDGYEGWSMAETPGQKRELVKNAVMLHWHKGTRYSLERIFTILGMRGLVTEWWESSEPVEDFPPYTFDIDVEVSRPVDERFYSDVLKLIFALKNARSHLRKARIYPANQGKAPVVASASLVGMWVTVQPYMPNDVVQSTRLPFFAGCTQTAHTITIHPMERQ